MTESTLCYSKQDKPGKYEFVSFFPNRYNNRFYPDIDKKRIKSCVNPKLINKTQVK